MNEIEYLGLERKINRCIFEEPYIFEVFDEVYENTKGFTFVILIDPKDDNTPILDDFTHLGGTGDIESVLEKWLNTSQVVSDIPTIKGWGLAVCSAEDQFSKREGRLIATGRALKKAFGIENYSIGCD